tara:strand:- start:348 stop:482 length:135 start_codon:yes stop_codon:yes gene_type:complete
MENKDERRTRRDRGEKARKKREEIRKSPRDKYNRKPVEEQKYDI